MTARWEVCGVRRPWQQQSRGHLYTTWRTSIALYMHATNHHVHARAGPPMMVRLNGLHAAASCDAVACMSALGAVIRVGTLVTHAERRAAQHQGPPIARTLCPRKQQCSRSCSASAASSWPQVASGRGGGSGGSGDDAVLHLAATTGGRRHHALNVQLLQPGEPGSCSCTQRRGARGCRPAVVAAWRRCSRSPCSVWRQSGCQAPALAAPFRCCSCRARARACWRASRPRSLLTAAAAAALPAVRPVVIKVRVQG